jgi:ribosome maturation factor RimP
MAREHEDPVLEAVRNIADRAAAECGIEVVDITLRGGGHGSLLRIDIDRPGPIAVGIEECRKMSGAVSELLDADDPIPHGYTLEVSSPGIDRPIVTDADLRRNTGRRVLALTSEAVSGKRELRGVLASADRERIVIRDGEQEIGIPREFIVKLSQDPGF